MNNLYSLGAQNCPYKRTSSRNWTNALVHLSQPGVILLHRRQEYIGTYYLPCFGETCKLFGEIGLNTFVFETLLCGRKAFPSANGTVYTREEFNAFLQVNRDKSLNLVYVFDDGFYGFFIECKGLGHIIEDAYEVHYKAAFLVLVVGPIGAADSLEQRMILHRLVQVHTLKNRSVKASEQFTGHNDKLQWRQRIPELVEEFLLLVACTTICLVIVCLVSAGVHHNSCLVICAKQSIYGLLILDTAGSVINNHLSLHPGRLDILTEMVDNVFTDLIDAVLCRKECFHAGPANQFFLIILVYLVGQSIEFLL